MNQIVATRLHHGSIMTSTPSTPHWLFYAQVSILVEIQIHDTEVRKASAAQQRFYQIFRAISSEKLHKVEAHHTMTHSKLMKQRSQRHMLRTAKISSSRALKALHRNFSIRNTGRFLCINQKCLRAGTPAR